MSEIPATKSLLLAYADYKLKGPYDVFSLDELIQNNNVANLANILDLFSKLSYQRINPLMVIGHLSSHLIVACPFWE